MIEGPLNRRQFKFTCFFECKLLTLHKQRLLLSALNCANCPIHVFTDPRLGS